VMGLEVVDEAHDVVPTLRSLVAGRAPPKAERSIPDKF
jgi:hypothetical protein